MAKLMFKSGAYAGRALTLPVGKAITFGRNRDVSLPLPDPKLSRRHCQIFYDGQCVRLKDLSSTNGTFLNGTRLSANIDTDLKSHDRITIGAVEIEFLDVELAASASSSVKSSAESSSPVSALNFDDISNVEIAISGADSGFLIPNDSPNAAPTLQYADSFQAALAELSLPLPPEPPPLPFTTAKAKIVFCDNCNASIPQLDYDLGNAKEINGKLYCKHCLAQASTQQFSNIPQSVINAATPVPTSPQAANMPAKLNNNNQDDELEEIDQQAIEKK